MFVYYLAYFWPYKLLVASIGFIFSFYIFLVPGSCVSSLIPVITYFRTHFIRLLRTPVTQNLLRILYTLAVTQLRCYAFYTRPLQSSYQVLPGRCKLRGAGCGEIPTYKMWGKVRGLTPQFTCTNAPRPHDDHERGRSKTAINQNGYDQNGRKRKRP